MTHTIEAEGLTKRFGATQALDGVDLAAAEGTVLGVLGPNGAGKTTAVRILATLLRPDSGRATVAGYDVVKDASKVRRVVGLTGQYASVDEDLTGTQNLVMIGQLLEPEHQGRPRPVRRTARMVRPVRGRRPGGQDLLRRDAAPPRPRGQPGRPPAGHLPGRADHRSRPGQARGHVGRGAPAGHRRLHRPADHPVPGRGGRARRPRSPSSTAAGSSRTTPPRVSSAPSAASGSG